MEGEKFAVRGLSGPVCGWGANIATTLHDIDEIIESFADGNPVAVFSHPCGEPASTTGGASLSFGGGCQRDESHRLFQSNSGRFKPNQTAESSWEIEVRRSELGRNHTESHPASTARRGLRRGKPGKNIGTASPQHPTSNANRFDPLSGQPHRTRSCGYPLSTIHCPHGTTDVSPSLKYPLPSEQITPNHTHHTKSHPHEISEFEIIRIGVNEKCKFCQTNPILL